MITHPAPFVAPHPDAPGDPELEVQAVAQLVATTVSGLHRVNGQFVHVSATLGNDGYVDVEATRVDFAGEGPTVRVLLYPTAPVPVPARPVPDLRGTT